MKRGKVLAVVLVALLVLYYWNLTKKDKKKKSIQAANDLQTKKAEEEKKSNYYSGDKDFSTTGIYFYNIDWDRKRMTYLVIMDGEAIQGEFAWPERGEKPTNHTGSFNCSNQWRSKYRITQNKKGEEIALFEINNSEKAYNQRRGVNFTTKTID